MSDRPADNRPVCWTECFSFPQIFRSFRLAIAPHKLVLALVLVVTTYFCGRVLDALWAESSMPIVSSEPAVNELTTFIATGCDLDATREWIHDVEKAKKAKHWGPFRVLVSYVRTVDDRIIDAVWGLNLPAVATALLGLLMALVWLFVMHPLFGIVLGIVTMLLWAYFGGAIARAAALHATRDERIPFGEALGFAKGRIANFFIAPIMPAGIIVLLGLGLWVAGVVGLIPAVGEVIVGLLFFLALIAGFAIAFVLVGGIAGCNLTYPTIAVEGSDAFDAFSRTFSYIYARPWRTGFYYVLAIAYGAICFVFVKLFVRIMLWAVALLMGLSMNAGNAYYADPAPAPSDRLPKLEAIWHGPSLIGDSAFYGTFEDAPLAHLSWFAQVLIRLWVFGVWAMVAAFLVSLYFSANTLIYLLLRREVDSTDLEDVYLEDSADSSMPAPPPGDSGSTPPADSSGGTPLPVIGSST